MFFHWGFKQFLKFFCFFSLCNSTPIGQENVRYSSKNKEKDNSKALTSFKLVLLGWIKMKKRLH